MCLITSGALVDGHGLGPIVAAILSGRTDRHAGGRIDTPADVWSSSTTGMTYIGARLVSLVAMVVAMFILARTFLREARWRPLFPWLVLQPGAALDLTFVQQDGPWIGLMRRHMTGVIAVWR